MSEVDGFESAYIANYAVCRHLARIVASLLNAPPTAAPGWAAEEAAKHRRARAANTGMATDFPRNLVRCITGLAQDMGAQAAAWSDHVRRSKAPTPRRRLRIKLIVTLCPILMFQCPFSMCTTS
eukprot:6181682-Pleurochrysis_carterae.AAC.6